MGDKPIVMKNISRTQAAKAGKRKPWFRGQYEATAKKVITKAEPKAPKYYAAEDTHAKLNNNKVNNKQTKLKSSLVPGAIVILLAGRFKGKRAVFLKQLDSGLCLITGPFKVNGIPLRRVPQSYLIGTSTVVDASNVDASAVNDTLFKKPKTKGKKAEESTPLDAEFKALQSKVDGGINLTDDFKGYLKSKFGLSRADMPHEMSF